MTEKIYPSYFPNSREEFHLKLLARGADEVMTVERTAEILGVRSRTLFNALSSHQLELTPAISLTELATWLFRYPGISTVCEPKTSASGVTIEQLDHITETAQKILDVHSYLSLDRCQLVKAISIALLRNPSEDWRQAVKILSERLIGKITQMR